MPNENWGHEAQDFKGMVWDFELHILEDQIGNCSFIGPNCRISIAEEQHVKSVWYGKFNLPCSTYFALKGLLLHTMMGRQLILIALFSCTKPNA